MLTIFIGKAKPEFDASLPEEFQWHDNYMCQLIDDSCFEAGSCRVYSNEYEALAGIMQAVDGIAEAPEEERKSRANFAMALTGALQKAIEAQTEEAQDINTDLMPW